MSRNGHRPWADWEDEYLREHYGRVAWQAMIDRLGRTKPAISVQAGKLGLRRKKEPPWTEEEFAYLRSNWGVRSLHWIARKLRRSPNAVKIKVVRLKLGPSNGAQGDWSVRLAASVLGVDDHVVGRWIARGLLPARKLPCCNPQGRTNYRSAWQIRVPSLIKFLQAHPDLWDATRCPDLHLSLGRGDRIKPRSPIPGWFARKLAEDQAAKANRPPREAQKWTPMEDRHLAQLRRRGVTCVAIGEALGRSTEGVERRLWRLGRAIWTLEPPPLSWSPTVLWRVTPNEVRKPPAPAAETTARPKGNPGRARRLMELLA